MALKFVIGILACSAITALADKRGDKYSLTDLTQEDHEYKLVFSSPYKELADYGNASANLQTEFNEATQLKISEVSIRLQGSASPTKCTAFGFGLVDYNSQELNNIEIVLKSGKCYASVRDTSSVWKQLRAFVGDHVNMLQYPGGITSVRVIYDLNEVITDTVSEVLLTIKQ